MEDRKLKTAPGEKAVTPTKSKAHAGTAIYDGYVYTHEKNAALSGKEKYVTYSENLSNVTIVGASTAYFLALVAKASWRVDPADETEEAVEKAELFEEMLHDMDSSWTRVVKRAAMHKMYGFSLQEWTAKKRDDGVIGLKSIRPIAQVTVEQWDTDNHGNVLGIRQRSPQTQESIYVPIEKMIYFVDDSLNDSPEGLGMFRLVAETAFQLRRFEQLEGFGYETDLRGIPIGRAPLSELKEMVENGDLTKAEATAVLAPFRDFLNNHIKGPNTAIMVDSATYRSDDESASPSGAKKYSVELLSSSSSSVNTIGEAILRKQQEIARVMGTENLLVGSGGGSNALSRDKSQTFRLTVDSVLRELAKGFSSLVDTIWDLNGWDDDIKPKLSTEALQFDDVTAVTTVLRDIALSGAPLDPNDPAIDEVREMVGLSPSVVNEETMEMDEALLYGNVKPPPDPSDPNDRFRDQRLVAESDDEKTSEEKASMAGRQRDKMVRNRQT